MHTGILAYIYTHIHPHRGKVRLAGRGTETYIRTARVTYICTHAYIHTYLRVHSSIRTGRQADSQTDRHTEAHRDTLHTYNAIHTHMQEYIHAG